MGHPVAVQEVDRVAKIIGHGLDLTNGEGVELIVLQKLVNTLAKHFKRNAHMAVIVEPISSTPSPLVRSRPWPMIFATLSTSCTATG